MKFLESNRFGSLIFKYLVISAIVTVFSFGLSQIKKKEEEKRKDITPSPNYELLFFVENIGDISIIVTLIGFIIDLPEKEKKRIEELELQKRSAIYEAWQVINSAQGQQGNGGRVEALKFLKDNKEDLSGLSASNAHLHNIDLSGIRLYGADFSKSDLWQGKFNRAVLEVANLSKVTMIYVELIEAQLWGADLTDANLSGAKLRGADLAGAKLNNVIFCWDIFGEADLSEARFVSNDNHAVKYENKGEADLEGAKFSHNGFQADIEGAIFWDKESGKEAKNITPEQIKQAENWEKGIYSPAFRKELGLPH